MKPIISFGLIVYCIDRKTPKFCIIHRRDSYAYIDFFRAKWKPENFAKLFRRMTKEEQHRIFSYDLATLYKDFKMNQHVAPNERLSERYAGIDWEACSEILAGDNLEQSMWGLPKGRKNKNEFSIDCALREFREETNINDIISIIPHKKYIDDYRGTDSKSYRTIYYLARISNPVINFVECDSPIRKSCISDEVTDLKWVSFEEAHEHLPNHLLHVLSKIEIHE